MTPEELNFLTAAYQNVYEGASFEINPTAHQAAGKLATTQRKIRNLAKDTNVSGERDAALSKLKGPKLGLADEYEIYEVILSHLLDEGYADTQEAAVAIMASMSEEWRESIMETMYQTIKVPKTPFFTKRGELRRKGFLINPERKKKDNYDQYNDPGIPKPGA
jgi:hypothetical protein